MVRLVALGDSLTEGVGDPCGGRPNGLRGWADLLAAHLASTDPATDYANLALRGCTAADVVDSQLPLAVAMRPDIATVWVGGNDLLRPVVDVDRVAGALERCLVDLTAVGARVAVFTGFELTLSPVLWAARARAVRLNARVRAIAARHGADLVEVSDFARWSTAPLMAPDRVHPSPLGHRHLSHRVAAVLDRPFPGAPEVRVPGTCDAGIRRRWQAELRWWTGSVAPHVRRWVEGATEAEAVVAKWCVPVRPGEVDLPAASDVVEPGARA